MNARSRIDHLVVVADTLDQGLAWCEANLGVTPAPGGQHPLMGTHNRLLRIATVDYPRAYLEIIAVDPAAGPPQAGRRRWFDMDDAAVRKAVREDGPRLLHWVAQVPDVRAAVHAFQAQGIDRGEVVAASRETARGLLQWQITLRMDGARLEHGLAPTLIQWGDAHPASMLPESGVTLHGLVLTHPDAARLRRALDAVGIAGVQVMAGEPNLCAQLIGPRGAIKLDSKGL